MTLSNLKRDLQKGRQVILTFGPKKECIGKVRFVVSEQSNGVYLNHDINASKGSFLKFPPASLMEYDGKTLKIFSSGERELTAEEKAIKDNEPKDEEQSRIDIMTDGSTMYWRTKRYYSEQKAEYLQGHDWQKGCRFNFNSGKVYDRKIKGTLSLAYTII